MFLRSNFPLPKPRFSLEGGARCMPLLSRDHTSLEDVLAFIVGL